MNQSRAFSRFVLTILIISAFGLSASAGPQAGKRQKVTIESLQRQIAEQSNRLRSLEQEQHLIPTVMEKASSSVGLIVGEYVWTDTTGRRILRYKGFDKSGNLLRDSNGTELSSFTGEGPVIVREFEATAFLVDRHHLLTSGFLLSPWRSDPLLDESDNPEVVPSIRLLHVYFPAVKTALDAEINGATESGNVVICSIDGDALPQATLPIGDAAAVNVGAPIAMLGYPGGVQLLLSRLPDELRRELYKFGEPGVDETAEFLAQNGFIHPIAFQSRVSGQTEDRVFFETTESYGSTGGPLINAGGNVIGMSQSFHTQFPTFNMGILMSPLKPWIDRVASTDRQ